MTTPAEHAAIVREGINSAISWGVTHGIHGLPEYDHWHESLSRLLALAESANELEHMLESLVLAVEKAKPQLARIEQLETALQRAAFIAGHLFQMIDPTVWRTTGGDDGQGHYEGDYHAEELAEEIRSWTALTKEPA